MFEAYYMDNMEQFVPHLLTKSLVHFSNQENYQIRTVWTSLNIK